LQCFPNIRETDSALTQPIEASALMGHSSEQHEFVEMRFTRKDEAAQVVSAIQSLVDCPLGAAFRGGNLEAIILRGSVEWEPVLFFSRGAQAAARLGGIRLPLAGRSVFMNPSLHVSMLLRRAAEPEPQTPGFAGSLRVLIVEDHRDTAEMLGTLLESWGFIVALAHSGAQAVEVAHSFKPRVVLLDLGLPDQHGYWVANRIRQEPEHQHTSFVVVTGWTQAADPQLNESAGISHHLVKPVDPDMLHSVLDQFQSPTMSQLQ
jgi:CheY-like chemotaxis protein